MKAINPRRQAAGRKGGIRTLELHGQKHFIKAGMMGGRPRVVTIEDIRLAAPNLKKEERLPTGLRSLKRVLRQMNLVEEGGRRQSRTIERCAQTQV